VSLINKMLKDLESRQDGSDKDGPRMVYEDLQASRPGFRSMRRSPPILPILVIVLSLVAGAIGSWYFLSGQSTPVAKPVPPTPPPATVAEAAPEVKPAPAPHVPVFPDKPKKPPAPLAPIKPATREKPAVAEPRPVAKPRVQAPAPVAVAPVARPGQMEKVVKPLAPGELANNAYREAASLMQQGRGDEAEARLRTNLGQYPGHAASRELLVGVLLQRGARDEARQQLETGITQTPEHLVFYSLLARLFVDAGQEARALALLESAAARAANDVDYQRFLAALYQRAGRHGDAVKAWRQVVTLRPFDGRGWLGLGISLEAMEHWKDAANAYQRALAGQGLDERLSEYVRQRQAYVKSK
jgi:MSHA biogenesis protein MshN